MIRTYTFSCALPKGEADALNRESGRVYTNTLVRHYRIYRKSGHWLSPQAGERVEDSLGPSTLHAHSRDAAQQGFYKACKTARALKAAGFADAHYPHKRKYYRTSIWKNTGIRHQDGTLLLARARGLAPVRVPIPASLTQLPGAAFAEVRLVWDQAARRYAWHAVIGDGMSPQVTTATGVAGVDLGEIHPAALTDGRHAAVISCRALRASVQYTHKRLAVLQVRQGQRTKGSSRWKRLQRRKNRFLAQQKRRERDLLHKASRAVVGWAQAHQVGTLAIGDVRDVGNGRRLAKEQQQKVSGWSHGTMRRYIGYKAAAIGITVIDGVSEAYTSQTCPGCGARHKPKGRVYACRACGFRGARDVVGAANILSRYLYHAVGRVPTPPHTMYLRPFVRKRGSSRLDTADLARGAPLRASREAAPL
ncbi:MAG TPA: transposase [Chloroflexota bacterium]|nr:transposase [Chloroflexota bacterium]